MSEVVEEISDAELMDDFSRSRSRSLSKFNKKSRNRKVRGGKTRKKSKKGGASCTPRGILPCMNPMRPYKKIGTGSRKGKKFCCSKPTITSNKPSNYKLF